MSLEIELPPELQQELERAAARRGQSLQDYARCVLERSRGSCTAAEAVFESFWRDLRRRSPADLVALARTQGVAPVADLDALAGGWPEDDNLEDFLASRERWQWEGRVPGTAPDGVDT